MFGIIHTLGHNSISMPVGASKFRSCQTVAELYVDNA